jgi:hypothetical protein
MKFRATAAENALLFLYLHKLLSEENQMAATGIDNMADVSGNGCCARQIIPPAPTESFLFLSTWKCRMSSFTGEAVFQEKTCRLIFSSLIVYSGV